MYIPIGIIILLALCVPIDTLVQIALICVAVYFWYITIPLAILFFIIAALCYIFDYIYKKFQKNL